MAMSQRAATSCSRIVKSQKSPAVQSGNYKHRAHRSEKEVELQLIGVCSETEMTAINHYAWDCFVLVLVWHLGRPVLKFNDFVLFSRIGRKQ
jgi:hypothetical protein